MLTTKMRSKMPHEYAGKNLEAGDEFDCEQDHIQLLSALGRAEVIPQQVANTYVTRDMLAADSAPQHYHVKRSGKRNQQ